ncbi:hypothetical protein [Methanosarcina acetivorans]|uniref:hypothetical protein n=1 Tax=Methanosarcina acetivorans TaxID=2214 RepID=UPI00064EC91F|nr:hypothetical protein [Methanosarcina acetivorans]
MGFRQDHDEEAHCCLNDYRSEPWNCQKERKSRGKIYKLNFNQAFFGRGRDKKIVIKTKNKKKKMRIKKKTKNKKKKNENKEKD